MLLRLSVIIGLLALTACGFTPMYGSSGHNAPKQLEQVDIALIPNESGVYLRNLLIDNFYQDGYPKSPAYTLSVANITEAKTDLDITIESDATRKQITLTAIMVLVDSKTGQAVLSRNLRALTSYNVLDSQFTTRVSEQDAREAALADLARQIENQVVLYLKR